jgi:hypothetical protein
LKGSVQWFVRVMGSWSGMDVGLGQWTS